MSCEWIKQEPLEENEIQFEAGLKQEIPLDVEETQSVKVEDGETYHKNEEDYALESDSQLKVILVLVHFPMSIIHNRVIVGRFCYG